MAGVLDKMYQISKIANLIINRLADWPINQLFKNKSIGLTVKIDFSR